MYYEEGNTVTDEDEEELAFVDAEKLRSTLGKSWLLWEMELVAEMSFLDILNNKSGEIGSSANCWRILTDILRENFDMNRSPARAHVHFYTCIFPCFKVYYIAY